MSALARARRARYASCDCLCGGSDVWLAPREMAVARAFATILIRTGNRRNAGIGSEPPTTPRISISFVSPRPLAP
jgi:hypothetical protein